MTGDTKDEYRVIRYGDYLLNAKELAAASRLYIRRSSARPMPSFAEATAATLEIARAFEAQARND